MHQSHLARSFLGWWAQSGILDYDALEVRSILLVHYSVEPGMSEVRHLGLARPALSRYCAFFIPLKGQNDVIGIQQTSS
jgi:hypothetical protein